MAKSVHMPKSLTWGARVAFATMVAVALLGAIDPKERFAAVGIAPDAVSHAALSYALTLLLLASFRGARPLATGAFMLLVGASLEVLQSLGLFAGDGHWSDLRADALGIAFALLPLWIGRAQGRKATEKERGEVRTGADKQPA
jgi:hypothetical protein